jgi:GT2 family glycosyltransferase/glycosyltransferase involved in cell wall biosynthesis
MTQGRIVFVTTELYPETQGGAGVVVDALARHLAGHRPVLVVLAVPDPVQVMGRDGVEIEVALIPPTGFLERSEMVASTAAGLIRPGDRVEVQDFEGLGYSMLVERVALGLEANPMTVRFHGPYDLLREAMETDPGDWLVPAAMERGVFQMADQVLIPVPGHEDTLAGRYGVDPERVVVSPPPIPPVEGEPSLTSGVPVFAAIGRLGEMKGSQDLVFAALGLLDEGVTLRVRFVGGDGWSPTAGSPMSEWLLSLIPDRHRSSFEFLGSMPRHRLSDVLDGVSAVVVPSRFESFCLAAHEARRFGLPVVVPDLPAFEGLFDETTGALVYDRTVPGLAAALLRLATEEGLAGRLGTQPLPDPGDTWDAYRTDPEPRHPRSQAGLATEASKAVEKASPVPPSRVSPALGRLYRGLPAPAARVLARLAPKAVKDRLRHRASWPAERARVQREKRLGAVQDRIAAGEFAEIESPDITVVIPVYDDISFLEEALASVYEQNHPSWEIVLVDDGSTDPTTIAFLDQLQRPRLRLHRQGNTGLPGARNAGMKLARGEFLVPLDSDDELAPEFMSTLLTALRQVPEAGFAHCLARLHGDIEAIWMPRPFNPYWQLLENSVVGCVLMRAAAWESVGGYDETMTSGNEDWELWLRLTGAGWGQVRVEEPLFLYRKHGVSMSVTTEGRFEEGRRMVRDRNPALYGRGMMDESRRRWYPLLTVVGATNPVPDDAELVTSIDDLATSWGKYVVDLRGFEERVSGSVLLQLADLLETNPDVAFARTSADPPLALIRRWNLHDPDASPDGEVVLLDHTTGPQPLRPGSMPRPGWFVPDTALEPGLPVQRQRPEESAITPDPERW